MSNKTNSFGIYDAPISNQNGHKEPLTLSPFDITKQLAHGGFFMDFEEAIKEGLITENDNIETVSMKGA